MDALTQTISFEKKPPKRKQVGRACSNCRQSKTACDDNRPCTRCTNRGIGHSCIDAPKKRRSKKKDITKHESPAKRHKANPSPIQPNSLKPKAPLQVDLTPISSPSLSPTVQHRGSSSENVTIAPLSPISIPKMDSKKVSPLLPRIPSKEFFSSAPSNLDNLDITDSPEKESVDCSSTPFLSLKHHPTLFVNNRLPPITSNVNCELPFRTVAEPTVDLFSDTLHKPPPKNLSFSDESLELSGIRKNPSLETLLSNVLRESQLGDSNLSKSKNKSEL